MTAAAQAPSPRSAAEIVLDGKVVKTVPHLDSLAAAAASYVDSLRSNGFYFARIDTVFRRDDSDVAQISAGPRVEVGRITFEGVSAGRTDDLLLRMDTRPGSVLDAGRLEADLDRILTAYEREGRLLAEASVAVLELIEDSPPRMAITIRLDEGPVVDLKRIELEGAERTDPSLVARLAGLETGRPIRDFSPERIQRRLEEADFFETVGVPEIYVEPDTGAVLRIPIEEGDPGTFDIVLGYLPPANSGDRGRIIGNGHLALRNLFGRGRSLAVMLSRLPGQASSIDAQASDPFVLGLPLGAAVRFHGLEQDSTYGKQAYRGEIRYHVTGGMDVFGGFSREITGPGQAGLRLGEGGRQIIPDADAWFLGIGARVSSLDRAVNPTRGFFVEMNLETGRKERSERRVIDEDTTRTMTLLEQKRLQSTARIFVPAFARQVLAAGWDAGLLLSNEYDRSDLFRFGGATSLRGYDEDRFLGNIVSRVLVEYRFLIDRISFAYAFFDLGYVERPKTPDLAAGRSLRPGYGIGIQFRTAVGLVNVSAALSPEGGPTNARIHAGLSFGL